MSGIDSQSQRLAGKPVYVTGAAGGIGNAICQRLQEEGALVVGMGRSSNIDRWHNQTGIPAVSMDQSSETSVTKAFAEAHDLVGPPAALVACAGIMHGSGAFEDIELSDWQRYIDVNLTGTFLACRSAARMMVRAGDGGSIVTVGSVNSVMSEPNAASYAASKGGIWMMTRAMSVDLARHQIRANMIAPGFIDTDANSVVSEGPAAAQLNRQIAMGRAGLPIECAGVAAMLVSDDSTYMTGAHIVIDGGLTSMLFGALRPGL